MLKKTSLGLLGVMVLLMSVAALPALGYVEAGNKLGDLEFSAPLSPEDATYLGVPADKPFKLSQVGAPYVWWKCLPPAAPIVTPMRPI